MASSNTTRWLRVGMYGALQRASVILFGMISTLILAHWAIEPAQLGVWALFLVITSFVETLRHGLIKASLIKYLNASTAAERPALLSSALVLNTLITLVAGLILVTGSHLITQFTNAPELRSMIYWNILVLLFLIPFSHAEWLMISGLDFRNLFYTYIVRNGVTVCMLLVSLVLGMEVSLNMLVLYYATGIGLSAVTGLYLKRKEFTRQFKPSLHWIKTLLQYGRNSFGTGLSNLVFRSSDSFLLSNLLSGTTVVGMQGIAMRIFNLADIPSQMIADMVFPKSAAIAPGDHGTIRYYYERSVGITLAIILPAILFIVIFPQVPILIVAGPKYLAAIPYLRILMLVSLFLCFLKQFGTIMDGSGKPQVNFIFTTLLALANLLSCYFFIGWFGLMGAAYGLLFVHVLAFVASQYLLNSYYQVRFTRCFGYTMEFYFELLRMLHKKTVTQ